MQEEMDRWEMKAAAGSSEEEKKGGVKINGEGRQ